MLLDTMTLQRGLTSFGDIAVVGPAAIAAIIWLAYAVSRQSALGLAWPIAATFVITAGLKSVMRATGGAFSGSAFAFSTGAPSGHMGMSTVVYGGLTLILLKRSFSPVSILAACTTLFILAAVAVTRVTLHAHLPMDVAAGLLIGGIFARRAAAAVVLPAILTDRKIVPLLVIVAAVVTVMLLSGLRVDSAKLI